MQYVVEILTSLIGAIVVLVPVFIKFKQEKNESNTIIVESMKCSLRNDILSIYDNCKTKKKITMYQLQAITYSYKQYKALGGNSFVDEIMNIVKGYEVVD